MSTTNHSTLKHCLYLKSCTHFDNEFPFANDQSDIYIVLRYIKSDINYVINLRAVNETYPSIYINYIRVFRALNNMALCALRAIDFFSRNVTLRTPQTYVIVNRNSCYNLQAHTFFFSFKNMYIGDNFASRDNEIVSG